MNPPSAGKLDQIFVLGVVNIIRHSMMSCVNIGCDWDLPCQGRGGTRKVVLANVCNIFHCYILQAIQSLSTTE
jgi:hypothetical protein